jgi:hypothetical protein
VIAITDETCCNPADETVETVSPEAEEPKSETPEPTEEAGDEKTD